MTELEFVVTLPTHIAKVTKTSSAIHCWKFNHNQSKTDYQLFYPSQTDQASDYIITPLPSLEWIIELHE